MSKSRKPRPSGRRRASLGIMICFVAAVVAMGTYSLKSYRKAARSAEETEETKKSAAKKEAAESANTDRLTADTGGGEEEDSVARGTGEKNSGTGTQEAGRESDGDSSGETPAAGSSGDSAQSTGTATQSRTLEFTEESQLLWPVDGQVLMSYSMDKTIYFATLDQYRYNPAVILSGAEGDQVISSAAGLVKSIDVTARTGTTVNLDLGNGYELFIGQLKEVPVKTGDYVDANTVIGYVSQPTKYYAKEGCNIYYEMRKDGQPTDPMEYMNQ